MSKKHPTTVFDLQPASDWALFLDVDGTLLPFAERPDLVQASDRLKTALGNLGPLLEGAVALVSGRTIGDLDRLFQPLRLPAAGLHGLERRDAAGNLRHLGEAEALDHLRDALSQLASCYDGVLLEDKGRTLALHYRQCPEKAKEIGAAVDDLFRRLPKGFRKIRGKMVIEIKPHLSDKGEAIAEFMEESPFAGRIPIFIGDDVTDEDGFAKVNALGGHSVRVGNDRPTQARCHLEDVNVVVAWLESLPGQMTRVTSDRPAT